MSDEEATSQSEHILRWLKSGKSITPLEALCQFGCFRLAARIRELRRNYGIIMTKVNRNGKWYAEYRMEI